MHAQSDETCKCDSPFEFALSRRVESYGMLISLAPNPKHIKPAPARTCTPHACALVVTSSAARRQVSRGKKTGVDSAAADLHSCGNCSGLSPGLRRRQAVSASHMSRALVSTRGGTGPSHGRVPDGTIISSTLLQNYVTAIGFRSSFSTGYILLRLMNALPMISTDWCLSLPHWCTVGTEPVPTSSSLQSLFCW